MSKKSSTAASTKTKGSKLMIEIPDLDKRFGSYLKGEKLDIFSVAHFAAIQAEELNHSKPEIVKGRKEDAAMMVIHLLVGSGFIKSHADGDQDLYDGILSDMSRVPRLLEMYCKITKDPNSVQRKMWQKRVKKTGWLGLSARDSSAEDEIDGKDVKKAEEKKEAPKDKSADDQADVLSPISPASPSTPVEEEKKEKSDDKKSKDKKGKKSKKDDSDLDSDEEEERKKKEKAEKKKEEERKKKEEADRKKKEAEEKKAKSDKKKKDKKSKKDSSDSDSDSD